MVIAKYDQLSINHDGIGQAFNQIDQGPLRGSVGCSDGTKIPRG